MPAQADSDSDQHPLTVALRLLRADAPADIQREPRSWPRWALLLPHVLAVTASPDQDQEPSAGMLEDTSRLLRRAGTQLRVRARLNDALPLFQRALAIDEAVYGPDHPDVASDLNNLAGVLTDLGHPEQAIPLFSRALTINEAAYGPDHPTVATRLNNLGLALLDLGDPGQAQPLLQRALAISEAAYGPDHPKVATILSNLAAVLRDMGAPEQAEQVFGRGPEPAGPPGHR